MVGMPPVAEDHEDGSNNHDSARDDKRESLEAGSQISYPSMSSWGDAAIQSLDGDRVIETLPGLLEQSERMISYLVHPPLVEKIAKDLAIPGTSFQALVHYAEVAFNEHKRVYGEEMFINPSWVLRKFFDNRDTGTGDFRPDPVLQTANLAILAHAIMSLTSTTTRSAPRILELIDRDFPKQFLTGILDTASSGSSKLKTETFDISLDIKTQYLIAHLHKVKSDEGDKYMQPDLPKETLRLLFSNAVTSSDMEAGKLQERINAIAVHFHTTADGDAYDADKLAHDFPWLGFQNNIISWINARINETKQNIREQGGVINISKKLSSKAMDIESDGPETQDLTPVMSKTVNEGQRSAINHTGY